MRKSSLQISEASKSSPPSQVQSLSRALMLMQRLAGTEMGMNLTEVSGSLGLAPSTAHRLLNSLRHHHFVDYDEHQGLWSIGVNAFIVGNAYLKKRDFVAQARPYMKELVSRTGETSNLAIIEGESHIYVAQVECTEVMRMVVQLGSRGQIHAAAVGKALLAALPEKEALAIVQRSGMQSLTQKTITTPSDFAEELSNIRHQGYAVDDEEQTMGLRCIAANIFDEYAEAVAAVSISGPTVRITNERVPELSAAVIDTVNQITHAIGGRKPE